ncbi:MAG: tyrosine-type recombinase/integrase [Anaerolineales bacterium]|nr:tyrosine-type recombinase/integrase [Anaerolineales bacterium]MBS3752803.1 tyrosine-type recombinase/integrase [Anaerolineales bacterium]
MSSNRPNSIAEAIERYLDSVQLSRSENTARTYGNAMRSFAFSLEEHGPSAEEMKVTQLSEDFITDFAADLKGYAPNTEQLYLSAVTGFYEYIAAENLSEINLPRLRMLIKRRSRRPGQRLPQFPKGDIEEVIDYAKDLHKFPTDGERKRLQNLRDRAFILTLADTGLRVHEACNLRRGDIDWHEAKAVIVGKGNRQAVVRFSGRALNALRDYLNARAELDGAFGRSLTSLPLFARHDRGAGDRVEPISTTTGRNIVRDRVRESLGESAEGTITPHSFRHYFVTEVLQGSGGNIKLAQKLARHKNIQVTQRYAHLSDDELDRGYWEIFEEK